MTTPEESPFSIAHEQSFTAPVREHLGILEADYGRYEYLAKISTAIQLLADSPHYAEQHLPEVQPTAEDGSFHELTNRYCIEPETTARLVELGKTFSAADSETLLRASLSLPRGRRGKPERQLRNSLDAALAVPGELPPLRLDELRDVVERYEKNAKKQADIDVLYERFEANDSFLFGELYDAAKALVDFDATSLSTSALHLLVGVSVLQVVRLFEQPEVQQAIAGDKNMRRIFKEDESPAQHAINCLSISASHEREHKELLVIVTDSIAERLVTRKAFGKQKAIQRKLQEMLDVISLPRSLQLRHNLMQADQDLMTIKLGNIAQFTQMEAASRLVDNLEVSVDYVGSQVEEHPDSRHFMLEALTIDGIKKALIDRIHPEMLRLSEFQKAREVLGYKEWVQKLSGFSLHTALQEAESSRDDDHLREVYDNLLASAAEREERYSMSNKALRRADDGFAVSNLLRETFGLESKDQAMAVAKLLFALVDAKSEYPDLRGIFDQLLTDMDNELHDNKAMHNIPISIKGANGHGTNFEPLAAWLFTNSKQLSQAVGLPESIRSLLTGLEQYKLQMNYDASGLLPIEDEELLPPVDDPEPAVEPQDPEVDPLEGLIPPEFIGIADQLDWVVFPEGASTAIIRRMIEKDISSTRVNWSRLEHLVALTDHFGGRIYRSKDRNALGSSVPYLVAEFEIEERRFAVAECPEVGNATYIVCNELSAGSWQELMRLSRAEARSLGARRVIHPNEKDHLSRIRNQLNNLLVVKPVAG